MFHGLKKENRGVINRQHHHLFSLSPHSRLLPNAGSPFRTGREEFRGLAHAGFALPFLRGGGVLLLLMSG